MKRIVCTTWLVLALAAWGAAQAAPAGAASRPSAPVQRKAPLSAKTAEESAAYQAILTNPDLNAAESAAKDFEAKYPQSDLRGPLYQNLMYRFQRSNNAEKTVEMGRNALQFDGDNPMALVTVASILSERTRDTDLDRDQRLAEATKDAQLALDRMDNWLSTAPGLTDQQAQSVQPLLSAFAHAAMGMVELLRKNPAEAEKHYRQAVELNAAHPDAVTLLRLALSLDQQKKYAEALPFANQAVEVSAPQGGVAAELAKQEQERLNQLTGKTSPAPAAAPPPKS